MTLRTCFLAMVLAPFLVSCQGKPDEFETYKKFAEALAYGRFDEARGLGHGEKIKLFLDETEGLRREMADQPDPRTMKPVKTAYMLKQKSEPKEGEILLHVDQHVRLGDGSEGLAPMFVRKHAVRLRRIDGRWKIIWFSEE